MRNLDLHSIAENNLEAPALCWNSLAWYWGLSFLGMGPRYIEYQQSGEAEVDRAFYTDGNEDISRVIGFDQPMTIARRFHRAVDFYEYCCIAGKQSSMNPPWDYPPDIDTLIALRDRMEARPQSPDVIIQATTDSLLDNEEFKQLWAAGGTEKRTQRAQDYAMQVKACMKYIQSEIAPRMELTMEQLDKDTGFLKSGSVPTLGAGVTTEDMDEAMPQEKQWEKLGDAYIQQGKLVTFGIIGRYYNAGHNLETAMWNDERKRELSGIHHLTVRTWKQLMEINNVYTHS